MNRFSTGPRAARIGGLAGALIAAGLIAAGCGGSSSSSSGSTSSSASETSAQASTTAGSSSSAAAGGAAQVVKLSADSGGGLSYSTTTLTAHPGKVTIEFTNMAPLEHNLTVASPEGATLGATPTFNGGTKSVTLDLKAGTYSFYCTVPGHRQAGMQGTLKVQ